MKDDTLNKLNGALEYWRALASKGNTTANKICSALEREIKLREEDGNNDLAPKPKAKRKTT